MKNINQRYNNNLKPIKGNNHMRLILPVLFSIILLGLSSCGSPDPVKEDVPELITKVTLTFTPQGGGPSVIATAADPDGEGIQDIVVDGAIRLAPNSTYLLQIALINGLAAPTDAAYDITSEVEEEGDEHMFFFSWTAGVFANPAGNGNFDNRGDDVRYEGAENSLDEGGLPLGLTTTWTTAAGGNGEFRVVLKHQPDLKSATSSSSSGETDLDVTWTIEIE